MDNKCVKYMWDGIPEGIEEISVSLLGNTVDDDIVSMMVSEIPKFK